MFHDPPTERNRVWQTDFSEFETARGGIWRIYAVIDYATKVLPRRQDHPTGRGVDALDAQVSFPVPEWPELATLIAEATSRAGELWSTHRGARMNHRR